MPDIRSRPGVGPTYAFIFAVSIVLMLFGWRWAAQVAEQSPEEGYVIDVAASALPAAAAWWSALALRQRRFRDQPLQGGIFIRKGRGANGLPQLGQPVVGHENSRQIRQES